MLYKIASFQSSDYKSCLDIRIKVFVDEQGVPAELELADEAESIHFLGALGDKPVCTGRLRRLPAEQVLKFERIATLKEFRSQGHGRNLMLAMQEYALAHFADCQWLMGAQVSALEFYQSVGWVIADAETFLDAGIEHYWLKYPH